ncbi:uncharacterized protein LOC106867350 [Octopus bimaculoides]|uniref:Uncharacterized protein n=1 Tax=Octopus bimaculoides TaxID=37653 RepID=A0A0L8I160_OCTBM|nr:uncharacterized protein LOC106867350 [Octopus bimaculoides]|eukprot:XP_014767685.1 PREDICTED: uncharacterized protein LOC106867350 [Octopus bimaculoides]
MITVKESSGNTNNTQSLNCKVTDLTDTHLKCEHIWWVQEIDQDTHKEVVLTISKQPKFHNGYFSKIRISDRRTAQVFSCKALCNLQTFTATCHLPEKKETSVECTTHFFATSKKIGQIPNPEAELIHLKMVLNILVFILCVLSIILILNFISCVIKKFHKKTAKKSSGMEEDMSDDVDNTEKDELETNKLIDEEVKPAYKPHNRPSILLNGQLLFEGDTPFAKVTYKSDKPVISFVDNTTALQNWDPGVSCFTLAPSESDSNEEYIDKKTDLLVPYNDCYERNHSASCPEVLQSIF